MALFTKVFGRCGPYWLNPICAALLTLCTYGLGVRASGRVTGVVAALLAASSPTVLFATMWPMSDVPAAFFWAASLLMASHTTRAASAVSGLLAGIAVAIRPNLAPLAVFPALIATWPLRREPRGALGQSLAFGSACLPFIVFIGWVNNDLYGSPLQSGYGQASEIFNPINLSANLARYPRWLWDTQGPLVFLFPLAVVIRGTPGDAGIWLRRFLLAFVGAVLACYLWYEPFDAWWYLRFVLPAFTPIFVLAADVVWRGTERFGTRARIAAVVVFTCVLIDHGITQARERGAFTIGEGEQKYADVGRYVAARLPANAVVFTLQHSGSIRYYAQRRTIQWQSLDGEWLDRAIAHLRATGYEPYFVLEEWEIRRFRQHFASQTSVAVLDRAAQAVHSRGVYIYETGARAGSVAPVSIPRTTGCE